MTLVTAEQTDNINTFYSAFRFKIKCYSTNTTSFKIIKMPVNNEIS